MKINYLTGCAAMAVLGLTLVGCAPKTDTMVTDTTNSSYSSSMSTTNDMMSATNAAMSAMTNAVDSSAPGDIHRGQYDTSLNTNLHNAEMTMTNMAGDMTNMVNEATNTMSSMTNSTM